MAFLRFTRDKRGYEHFQLVESTTRRGRTRTRVLYWFRTPPGVRVGREPFDQETQRSLEAKYPSIVFDWKRILSTPLPSAESEKWRERRREERAAKRARKARDEQDVEAPEMGDAIDQPYAEDVDERGALDLTAGREDVVAESADVALPAEPSGLDESVSAAVSERVGEPHAPEAGESAEAQVPEAVRPPEPPES